MNIVLPIVIFAVVVGLFVPERHIKRSFWFVALWILLTIANYWRKN